MSPQQPTTDTPHEHAEMRRDADAARFRAFVNQNAVGVAEADRSGKFLSVNRKFCELLGYSAAELLQMTFADVTHPDDIAQNMVHWTRFVDSGVPGAFEKRYIRKDGTVAWVYLSLSRIESGNARPAYLATVLDVTERRNAEAASRHLAERYRSLFNSIDTGFCIIEMVFDPDGRPIDYVFLEINQGFPAVSGFDVRPGMRIREVAPDLEEQWFDVYGRVARTGQSARFEHPARALNRYFRVHAFRVGGEESRQVGVLFEDVTSTRSSQMRRSFLAELAEKLSPLRREEEVIRATVEALGRFLEVDRCYFAEALQSENRVRVSEDFARPGLARMPRDLSLSEFGEPGWWAEVARGDYAVTDVLTDAFTQGRAEQYAGLGIRAYCVQPFREHSPWTVVLTVTDSVPRKWTDGEIKLLEDVIARVWPLVERARQEEALMAERQSLEERVKERTATLQETIAELESYSYSISHDLRAPLRAIQTYSSILTSEHGAQLSDDAREFLRRIIVASDRMDRLIRDVLVYSRVTRQEMPLERIELGSFIAGVVESYPNLRGANATIEIATPLAAASANASALTQCVANLLENAIKFARPGVKPHVRVWTTEANGKVQLHLRDNGIGVAEEAQGKIFGIFYQADPRVEGTGIGLAVVRKAAERMGGTVSVTSAPGQGSTFVVELRKP